MQHSEVLSWTHSGAKSRRKAATSCRISSIACEAPGGGLWVESLEFRAKGFAFRVQGSGFRVQSKGLWGFRVQSLVLRDAGRAPPRHGGSGAQRREGG